MFSTVVVPGVFNFLSWIMDGIAVLPDYARNKIAFARGIHTGIYQTVSYFYCLSSFSRLFCSEMDVKMYEGRQLCGKIATHETLILRALWCSISPAKLNATISMQPWHTELQQALTFCLPVAKSGSRPKSSGQRQSGSAHGQDSPAQAYGSSLIFSSFGVLNTVIRTAASLSRVRKMRPYRTSRSRMRQLPRPCRS